MQTDVDDEEPFELLPLTDEDRRHLAKLREEVEEGFRFGVRAGRELAGWTQTRLAEELAGIGLQLDATAITRIEKGERRIRLDEAWALAAVLRFSIDEYIPVATIDMRERLEFAEHQVRTEQRRVELAQRELESAKREAARLRGVLGKAERAATTVKGGPRGKRRKTT